eukprot:6270952-Prymnesium_polylepis.1
MSSSGASWHQPSSVCVAISAPLGAKASWTRGGGEVGRGTRCASGRRLPPPHRKGSARRLRRRLTLRGGGDHRAFEQHDRVLARGGVGEARLLH